MTTQTATRPTIQTHKAIAPVYVQNFSNSMIRWMIEGAVFRGDLPADLSAEYSTEALRNIYQNFRGDRDIKHRVLIMWYTATAREQSITVDQAAELVDFELSFWNSAWVLVPRTSEIVAEVAEVEPALTEEEVKAAKKIRKMLQNDAVTFQVFGYVMAGCDLGNVYFCNTAGISKGTMQARARAIISAAKIPRNAPVTIQQHLTKILKLTTKTEGGWAKTR